MKPILSTIAILFIVFFSHSQRVNYPPAPSSVYVPYGENVLNELKSTLWSDDISDPLNWNFTNISFPSNDWTIETDPEIVSISGPFQSASAANGFLFFKADTANGATSDAYAEYAGATIDLTGEPNIRIQFEQQYISDSNERTLEVSQDGITWLPFVISDGMSPTGAKEDGISSIDISSVAGNASDLHFRFHFSGSHDGYWAVDDIELRSIDSVDLRAVSVDWGSTGAWGVRMPYYSVIESQLQPIEFCLKVANESLVNIDTAIYSISEPLLAFSASDTFSIQTGLIETVCNMQLFPTSSGFTSYTFGQTLTANQTEGNVINNEIEDIEIGVDVEFSLYRKDYGRDNVFDSAEGEISSAGIIEYEVGNIFDFVGQECMTHVGFNVSPNATVGSEVTGKLYRFDTLTNEFILEDQTFIYTLMSGDIGGFVVIPLVGGASNAYCELENTSYLVTVHTYGEELVNYSNLIQTSGKSKPNTSFLIDWSSNPLGNWYYLSETPIVRLNILPVGLEEHQSNFNFNIAPNPANESTTLSFDLPSSSNVSFEIIDLSGKTVRRIESALFYEGTNELELNTSDLLNGVYFVKFTSSSDGYRVGSSIKRIIVQH